MGRTAKPTAKMSISSQDVVRQIPPTTGPITGARIGPIAVTAMAAPLSWTGITSATVPHNGRGGRTAHPAMKRESGTRRYFTPFRSP